MTIDDEPGQVPVMEAEGRRLQWEAAGLGGGQGEGGVRRDSKERRG